MATKPVRAKRSTTTKRAASKPARGVTFARLSQLMLAMPGVEAGTSYGTPSFRVKGKFMARLRDDDPGVLVLKPIDEIEKAFLLETQPQTFFITDHYRGGSAILIRLSKVNEADLAKMIERCWRALAPKRLLAQRTESAG
jgi:hypothetical protein